MLYTLIALSISLAQAKPVTYEVNGNAYEGYVINKGKKAPVVFIIHDWDGLTDYEIKRAEMLGKLKYSVFALDLFGKGVRPKEDKDRKQHTGELYADRKKMRDLMNAALEAAKKQGLNTDNSVVMGYCFGGAAVLEWARSGVPLKGFASFHGGLKTPEGQSYKETKGKIIVFHGSSDTAIPMEEFAVLAKELEAAQVPNEMIAYGGAPHAFTVFGIDRYRKEADEKSWTRFVTFLKDNLR